MKFYGHCKTCRKIYESEVMWLKTCEKGIMYSGVCNHCHAGVYKIETEYHMKPIDVSVEYRCNCGTISEIQGFVRIIKDESYISCTCPRCGRQSNILSTEMRTLHPKIGFTNKKSA